MDSHRSIGPNKAAGGQHNERANESGVHGTTKNQKENQCVEDGATIMQWLEYTRDCTKQKRTALVIPVSRRGLGAT
ncbi:hypothetical protein ZHAS_00010845 [Anopheles sinensis]|uniref:Uncharacterized protein n=1 Tax=Anopheles sinensis TaxID=74873 RepID=A0A084VYC6_ANOSI|nr:hypothetical protein ZHAS_00010845 [Anopheles sinensis]